MAEPEIGGNHRRNQYDHGGRQNPPRTPSVEARQRDRSTPLKFTPQQTGNKKARKDEEDIDANVAPPDRREAGVEEDDGQDCDRTQPLYIGAEAPLSGHWSDSFHRHR
jgi:hypothetical protein